MFQKYGVPNLQRNFPFEVQSFQDQVLFLFVFNVNDHKENYGYFLSTTEFEHQVAGLIEDMNAKKEYTNLYFWGPDKIFELLESAKIITPLDASNIKLTITKTILSHTYFGTFYILILMKDTIPSQFCVYDAK
ncbi:unnamed protein product, partial [marine sediment metagenome]